MVSLLSRERRPDVAGSTTGDTAWTFVDRWIFTCMAAWFLVTTLAGFVPNSFVLLQRVETGVHPPLTPELHVHAVLMGAWIVLLLVQTALVSTGHRRLHQTLGMASLVLAPLLVLSSLVLFPAIARSYQVFLLDPPAGFDLDGLARARGYGLPFKLLEGLRHIFIFSVLVTWAFLVRRRDLETHKRLMLLATAALLVVAINRLRPYGLPMNFTDYLPVFFWEAVWVAPLFVYDVIRLRRVPNAWWIWLAVAAPLTYAFKFLAQTPWWIETTKQLLGLPL